MILNASRLSRTWARSYLIHIIYIYYMRSLYYNWRVPRVVFKMIFLRFSSVSSKNHNNIRQHTHTHTHAWSRKDVAHGDLYMRVGSVGRSLTRRRRNKKKKHMCTYNLAKFAKTKTRSLRCWRLRVCHGLGVGAKAHRSWYSTGILRMCTTYV